MNESRDNNGGIDQSLDVLDAEREGGEKNGPVKGSTSELDGAPDGLADDEKRRGKSGTN